jgi:hypothetical protein
MRGEFVRGGGVIKNRHTLLDIAENSGVVHAVFQKGEKTVTWTAGRAILALHCEALKKIPRFAGWDVLKHLTMKPLLRVYAVYPVSKGKHYHLDKGVEEQNYRRGGGQSTTQAWFEGLSRVVTDGPLRYFLPSDPSTGQAMISYTDSQDAEPLMKMEPATLESFLQKELRQLFPDRQIPEPLFFKSHPWKFGVSYWLPATGSSAKGLPADYNVAEASRAAWAVGQRIHICGESFSQRQGWMEGALEHAEGLLRFLDAQ